MTSGSAASTGDTEAVHVLLRMASPTRRDGWRHTFISLSPRHGLDQEKRRMITGHAGEGVDEHTLRSAWLSLICFSTSGWRAAVRPCSSNPFTIAGCLKGARTRGSSAFAATFFLPRCHVYPGGGPSAASALETPTQTTINLPFPRLLRLYHSTPFFCDRTVLTVPH